MVQRSPQEEGGKRSGTLVGFLTVEPTQDQIGFIGALMVVDERGYPLEFRCTTPIRPTGMQKVLYGELLGPYVSTELCGKRLIAEVQRKPAVVVVSSPDLLVLDRPQLPVIAVQKAGEVIEVVATGRDVDRERIETSSGRFQPVILATRSDRENSIEPTKEVVRQLFQHCDLVEPFERIRNALRLLAKEDPKYG